MRRLTMTPGRGSKAKSRRLLQVGLTSILVTTLCVAPLDDAHATSGTPPPSAEQAEESLKLGRTERRQAQQTLRTLGFDPGAPDGIFGPRTREAIRQWQSSRGKPQTGYIDTEGLAALLNPRGNARRLLTNAISRARDAARRLDRANARTSALSAIAAAQALTGDAAEARRTIAAALESVGRIKDGFSRGMTLSHIAHAQASAGELADARSTADRIEYSNLLASTLSEIARMQTDAGDQRGAATTASEALAAARRIADARSRVLALTGVAEAQRESGDSAGAWQSVAEARSAADTIEDAFLRANGLLAIARAQTQLDDQVGARQTVAEAWAATDQIDTPLRLASILSDIAKANAEARDPEGAARAISQGLAAAGRIKNARRQGWALSDIAGAQAEMGDIEAGLRTAREIPQGQRNTALRRVSDPQARAGDVLGALSTASGIDDAVTHAWALRDIARALPEPRDMRKRARPATTQAAKSNDIAAGAWGAFLYGYGANTNPKNIYVLTWNAKDAESAFARLMESCRDEVGSACWPRYLSNDDIWFPDRVVFFSSAADEKIINEKDHVWQTRGRCALVYEDNCPYCRYNLIVGDSAEDVETQYRAMVARDRDYYAENYTPDMHRKVIVRCNGT